MSGAPYRLKDDPYSSHSRHPLPARRRAGAPGPRRRRRRRLPRRRADRAGWSVTALERDPVLAARAAARCEEAVAVDLERERRRCAGPLRRHRLRRRARASLRTRSRLCASSTDTWPPARWSSSRCPTWRTSGCGSRCSCGRFEYADRGILDRTHLRFFTRRTFLELPRAGPGSAVRELVVTPAPLPLVVPRAGTGAGCARCTRFSAGTARVWPGGLAYQFVAVCADARAPER